MTKTQAIKQLKKGRSATMGRTLIDIFERLLDQEKSVEAAFKLANDAEDDLNDFIAHCNNFNKKNGRARIS
jgi:hypothetical protein